MPKGTGRPGTARRAAFGTPGRFYGNYAVPARAAYNPALLAFQKPGVGGRRKALNSNEQRRLNATRPLPQTPPPRATYAPINPEIGYQQLEQGLTNTLRDIDNYNRTASSNQRADLSKYNAARKAGYQPAQQYDQYGRPLNRVDPELMARVMASEPKDNSGAFQQHDFYQGEDFINYLMEQGIVPHWGSSQSPSGAWVSYLLGKMGVTSYGVNPFAKPYPEQQAPPAGYYGGGGGGGGGGGYEPEPPKQYGSTRNDQGRNISQWLMDMLVWNI